MINKEQIKSLTDYLNEFKKNSVIINEGIKENYQQFDGRRVAALVELRALLNEFLLQKINRRNAKVS